MTDTQPTTQPNVVSRVDELRQEAINSRDAVRSQLSDLRGQRTEISGRIKGLVAEEEKLSRIVRNLERMNQNGEKSATQPE